MNILNKLNTNFEKGGDSLLSMNSDDSTKRQFRFFSKIILHGFECDIVVVSYYPEWVHEQKIELKIQDFNEMNRLRGLKSKNMKIDDNGDDDVEKNEGKGWSRFDRIIDYYSYIPLASPCQNNIHKEYYKKQLSQLQQQLIQQQGSNKFGNSFHSSQESESQQSFNEFIHSCKHRDRIHLLNIEIDGPNKDHQISSFQRSYHRDKYLKDMHKVMVRRVKLSDNHKLSPVELLYDELQLLANYI